MGDASKEREWAAQLGLLDWDNTRIVFNKRSLLEFLKYACVTVDPNFTNIQKLPRYATFGTFSSAGDEGAASSPAPAEPVASKGPDTGEYRPSRRVRTAPGGSHSNIFGVDNDDALSSAPPRPEPPAQRVPEVTASATPPAAAEPAASPEIEDTTQGYSRPRRSTSGVAGLWEEPDPSQQFKPTRRVREMPGGKDSISGLF